MSKLELNQNKYNGLLQTAQIGSYEQIYTYRFTYISEQTES